MERHWFQWGLQVLSMLCIGIIVYISKKSNNHIEVEPVNYKAKKDAVIAIILTIIITFVIPIIFRVSIKNINSTYFVQLMLLLVVIIVMKLSNYTLESICLIKKSFFKSIAVGFMLYIVYIFLVIFLFKITGNLPSGFDILTFINSFIHKDKSFIVLMLVVGICEELYFRGFLQSRLTYYLGNKIGLILTALIFVIWHIPTDIVNRVQGIQIMYNMILRLPSSVLFGFIMMKYKNISVPVVFHFLYNISG